MGLQVHRRIKVMDSLEKKLPYYIAHVVRVIFLIFLCYPPAAAELSRAREPGNYLANAKLSEARMPATVHSLPPPPKRRMQL